MGYMRKTPKATGYQRVPKQHVTVLYPGLYYFEDGLTARGDDH